MYWRLVCIGTQNMQFIHIQVEKKTNSLTRFTLSFSNLC